MTFVRVAGQANGAVPGTVFASLEKGAYLDPNEQVQTVGILGESLAYTLYSTKYETKPKTEIHLNLEVDVVSDRTIKQHITRYPPAVVKVSFKKCPFSFEISNVSTTHMTMYSCVCALESGAIESCSI